MSLERRLYKCDEPGCSKAYLTPEALQGHQNAHTKEVNV